MANIHLALPAMNEAGYIDATIRCVKEQTLKGFHTWICVNQPDAFWDQEEKREICLNNEQTLSYLHNLELSNLHIIDRSSRGRGWKGKNTGVGIARKTIMDKIADLAHDEDIIVSMDADTRFTANYLSSIKNILSKTPGALALANPYYHPLVADDHLNRAMLRYEIYMRYYALNMRVIGTPYCFTPLGSAMAATVKAYKKINGMTPKKSGEDFYFLQKLMKAGKVLMYNKEVVYPGNRLSDRVFFGTGPAMIKGLAGKWQAYPLFDPLLFEDVKKTIALFPELFRKKMATPMDAFLQKHLGEKDIFEPLRKNHKSPEKFVKACHEKIDGLRILQYLKFRSSADNNKDEDNLVDFIKTSFPRYYIDKELDGLDFSQSGVAVLNKIRNFLFENELKMQKNDAENNGQPL